MNSFMNNNSITFRPIGVIRSEHTVPEKTPIQPVYAMMCRGRAELFPEFREGLTDLDGFSHGYLIYHLDRIQEVRLKTRPFLQDKEHGIFATRAPWRPNPIGMSVVRILRCEENAVHFEGADILDGTPLLDIKPYNAKFDCVEDTRNGWYDEVGEDDAQKRGLRDYQTT